MPTGLRRQQAPAAGACLAPAHISVPPAAGALVQPHAFSPIASADDSHAAVLPVHTAPFEALTAAGNLLQGEVKNQIRVDY